MEILLKVFYSKSILSNIKKQIKPQNKQGIENTQLSSRKGGGWVTLSWGLKIQYSTCLWAFTSEACALCEFVSLQSFS